MASKIAHCIFFCSEAMVSRKPAACGASSWSFRCATSALNVSSAVQSPHSACRKSAPNFARESSEHASLQCERSKQ